jgi:hypothetical protein
VVVVVVMVIDAVVERYTWSVIALAFRIALLLGAGAEALGIHETTDVRVVI